MPSRPSSGGNVQDRELEELLEIISGNVVSEKSHQRTLRELLKAPAGIWRPAKELDRSWRSSSSHGRSIRMTQMTDLSVPSSSSTVVMI
jgi:hypothetical protein